MLARLREIASEDVSPTATGVIADVATLGNQWKQQPRKTGDHGLLLVVRAVIALAIAPKSRIADWATMVHASAHVPRRDIPDEALDKHTARGKQMGRGWPHFIEEASRLVEFDGDLEEMSSEYRDLFRRITEHDGKAAIGRSYLSRRPRVAKSTSPCGLHGRFVQATETSLQPGPAPFSGLLSVVGSEK